MDANIAWKDATVVRWLVAGVVAAHGFVMVGTALYLPWSIGGTGDEFVRASWLHGDGVSAIAVGVIVWLLAGAGYIGTAIGAWQCAGWWRRTAWIGAVFTLLAISLWVSSVPIGAYLGGLLAIGTITYLFRR